MEETLLVLFRHKETTEPCLLVPQSTVASFLKECGIGNAHKERYQVETKAL